MKQASRLHLIEHCNVRIKQTDDFIKMRIVTLDNGGNVFQSLLAFDFGSPDDIMFLLLCSIKPTEEQTRTLSLLTVVHTAHIKQNIGVLPEKLFNDTNNSLRYLFISRRGRIQHQVCSLLTPIQDRNTPIPQPLSCGADVLRISLEPLSSASP